MDESEARLMLRFGRAFRKLEGWVRADMLESTTRTMIVVFGDSPEFRLVEALARAQEALKLSEISSRCGSSERDVSRVGRLRLALARMERSGIVINVGTVQRPRFQLNLVTDEGKLLLSLFSVDDGRLSWRGGPVRESVPGDLLGIRSIA
jgi:hypothetical protein